MRSNVCNCRYHLSHSQLLLAAHTSLSYVTLGYSTPFSFPWLLYSQLLSATATPSYSSYSTLSYSTLASLLSTTLLDRATLLSATLTTVLAATQLSATLRKASRTSQLCEKRWVFITNSQMNKSAQAIKCVVNKCLKIMVCMQTL